MRIRFSNGKYLNKLCSSIRIIIVIIILCHKMYTILVIINIQEPGDYFGFIYFHISRKTNIYSNRNIILASNCRL